MVNERATIKETIQRFDTELDGVLKLSTIVGKGDDVETLYTNFSEVEVVGSYMLHTCVALKTFPLGIEGSI